MFETSSETACDMLALAPGNMLGSEIVVVDAVLRSR
jgi:hypothetical protein